MTDEQTAPTTAPETEQAAAGRPLSLLAAEKFGHEYHGEIPEESTEETPEEQTEETPDEEIEQGESEVAEADEGTGEDEDHESESEEVPIQSLPELIEHNEWDPDWFNGLKVPVKIDGREGEVAISDLVRSHQTIEAADSRLEQAKAEAKEIRQKAAEAQEAASAQLAVAERLIGKMESDLESEYAGIDWQSLKEDDPAEYAAKKIERDERRAAIREMKSEAAEEYHQATAEQQKATEAQMQEHLAAESAALLEKLPEWRDSEKAQAEKAELTDYLTGLGFSREDVMGASDHRLILMARDAMLYRKMKSNGEAARKKVVKVPKVLKPGAPKPQAQQSRENVNKAKRKLRQSGSVDDALVALRAKRGAA